MTTGPLDPETWRRVDALFEEALDLAPDARAALLERVGAESPALRAHVEELLAADARAADFLEEGVAPPGDALAGAAAGPMEADELAPGTRVSPWRVVREIGRGGMGAVYLAERDDGQFEQRAALKVTRAGMHGRGWRERFLQERRILARLEHPHIARLLDGGFLDDGRPWFAMEYVDGIPITEYVDRERLPLAARVDLFLRACRAVAHAQLNLVVHRDLKPSNVLVGADGEPKLLDFGIAKIFAEEEDAAAALAPGVTLTREGARILTPEYAAPEQLKGEAVTTATDVWALGCLLFELLAGRHPFAAHLDTPYALENAVLTGDTDRLPAAVTGEAAARRRTTTRRLRRALGGDLANIATRALAREPAARYANAADLAADLENWRRGMPVVARAPSARYRLAKAIRRHRVAFAGGVALFVAILAGAGATAWQARKARLEATRAVRVTEFLESLFTEADPNRTQGDAVTAAEVLARGAERLETEATIDDDLRAQLLLTVGSLYENLGDFGKAEELHAKSLALRTRLFGPSDPRVAESLAHLGAAHLAQSRYETADSLFTRALAIERRRRGRPDAALADAVGNLGLVRQHLGRYAEAESLLVEALAIDRGVFGARSEEVASDLSNLCNLRRETDRFEEAEAAAREALAIRRELYPGDRLEIATTLTNLGDVLRIEGRLDEAESLLREAVAMRRRLTPEGHPDLAGSLRTLGSVLRQHGEYAEAESLFVEALEMSRRLVGDDTFDVANGTNDLAMVSYFLGNFAKSRERFEDALARFERLLPPEHPTVLTVRGNLAAVLTELREFDEAERIVRASLAAREKAGQSRTIGAAADSRTLATLLTRRGRWDEAIEFYRASLSIRRERFGEAHRETYADASYLARALAYAGQAEDAVTSARHAVDGLRTVLPPDDPLLTKAQGELGNALRLAGRPDEALPILERVHATLAESGTETRAIAETAAWRGECLAALGRTEEARPVLAAAVPGLLELRGDADPLTREARRVLARIPPSGP